MIELEKLKHGAVGNGSRFISLVGRKKTPMECVIITPSHDHTVALLRKLGIKDIKRERCGRVLCVVLPTEAKPVGNQ